MSNKMPEIKLNLRSVRTGFLSTGAPVERKAWVSIDGLIHQRIEIAVLRSLELDGYQGFHDEGYWINQTMRAAMLCGIMKREEEANKKPVRHSRKVDDSRLDPRNCFAQGLLQIASNSKLPLIEVSQSELILMIQQCTKGEILEFLKDDASHRRFHASPTWTIEEQKKYSEMSRLIDMELLSRIAALQISTNTFAGFPDLTIWKENRLWLVEVKGPGDKLRPSQKATIENVLVPLRVDFLIATVSEVL
jgi:VRR-NUC domain